MAKFRHLLTKEGAILAITRAQVSTIRQQSTRNIRRTFLDRYLDIPDDKLKEIYFNEFGVKLEIFKPRNNDEESK